MCLFAEHCASLEKLHQRNHLTLIKYVGQWKRKSRGEETEAILWFKWGEECWRTAEWCAQLWMFCPMCTDWGWGQNTQEWLPTRKINQTPLSQQQLRVAGILLCYYNCQVYFRCTIMLNDVRPLVTRKPLVRGNESLLGMILRNFKPWICNRVVGDTLVPDITTCL